MKIHLEGHQTERLYFAPLHLGLLKDLLPFYSSKEALKHMIIPDDPVAFGTEWIARQIERYEKHGMGLMALKKIADDTTVGMCGLILQTVNNKEEVEIGYHLIPEYWGLGYASEAAIAAKNYAFTHELADSIISIIVVTNTPSLKVAKRNNMKIDFRTLYRGFDVNIHRITRKEWLAQT